MSLKDPAFPFSAIAGNELAKTAVLCALVNDKIKSVLITGRTGTGKTTLVRSVTNIADGKHLVKFPFNVNEEGLYGSIDLEKAIRTGEISSDDGLFARAHKNLVSFDDVDLADRRVLLMIMNSLEAGCYRTGQGDLSVTCPLDTKIFATACKNRQEINSHSLDRFDICATMRRSGDEKEAIRLELAFADSDDGPLAPYLEEDERVAELVRNARKNIANIHVSDKQMKDIIEICTDYGVKGCRGSSACAETAIAIAALGNQTKVEDNDIVTAAILTLEFRRTIFPKKEKKEVHRFSDFVPKWIDMRKRIHPIGQEEKPEEKPASSETDENSVAAEVTYTTLDTDDIDPESLVAKIGEMFQAVDLLESEDSNGVMADKTDLKRTVETPFGKYSSSKIPDDDKCDIALDATIRAAAPHQKARKKDGGLAVVIKKDDIREKVKTERMKTTFLFIIDASGSILIRNRIKAVKTAAVSMLENHYARRDRVGLMTFNDDKIEIVMEPSRATEELSKIIEKIAIGPGTPISRMFLKAYDYLEPYTRHHPNEICHVVLMTDGKATSPIDKDKDPDEEALETARKMEIHNTDWIVVDTGFEYTRSDRPKILAEALKGRYFLLDDLKTKEDTKKVW